MEGQRLLTTIFVNCFAKLGTINDPVDLVLFFCFEHNMQQSGTATIQYVVGFC